jgi:small-conductance mechanosensitive channel
MSFILQLYDQNWTAAIVVVVTSCLWWFATKNLASHLGRQRGYFVATLLNILIAPLVILSIGGIAHTLASHFGLDQIDAAIRTVTTFAVYLALGWLIARLIERVIQIRTYEKDQERMPGLIIVLIRFGFLMAGAALAMVKLDYSVTGVWVSTGVAVAVIGFAVQQTLGDLFSGIALSLEKPFNLDDWLELPDGVVGQVIDLNWRATQLRGWDSATHVIPNGQLANQGFKNYHGKKHHFAPWYEFSIPAEIDPVFVKTLLLEAALRCKHVQKDPLPTVRLSDATKKPYTYMIWVRFSNFVSMFSGREEMYLEVDRALKAANINVSSNTHDLYLHKAAIPNSQIPTVREALISIDIHHDLNDEELDEIAGASRYGVHETGTTILDQNAISDSAYIICNGVVEVSFSDREKKRINVEHIKTGEYFGMTSMLTEEPSEFKFTALTQVTVIRVDIDCVRALLERRPELAETFAKTVQKRIASAHNARTMSETKRRQPTFREILTKVRRSMK